MTITTKRNDSRTHAFSESASPAESKALAYLAGLDFEAARDFIRSGIDPVFNGESWQTEASALDRYLANEPKEEVQMRRLTSNVGMGPELIASVLQTKVGEAPPRLEALRPVVAITYELYLRDHQPMDGYSTERGDGLSRRAHVHPTPDGWRTTVGSEITAADVADVNARPSSQKEECF